MTHEIKPLIPVPKLSDERMKELYEKLMKQPNKPIPGNIRNLEDYIFMPQHGLYVAKERSHFNENWYDAHKALHQERARMLTLREFADFLILLRNGNDEFQKIYKDITEVRKPWRAEWLDAKFSSQGKIRKKWHIAYNDYQSNEVNEPLEDCLMSDKVPGIDLSYWLSNATLQGLPQRNNSDGGLYYWCPRDGAVARFSASSIRANLNCIGIPQSLDSALGVRAAKLKE